MQFGVKEPGTPYGTPVQGAGGVLSEPMGR